MKKGFHFSTLSILLCALLLPAGTATADDKVIVVPLGGTIGNANIEDVIKGKSFSSKAAGKGAIGTLEQHPMGQSYTNSIGMTFNLIPAGTFIMGSSDGSGSEPAEPGRDSRETQHQVTLSQSFYLQTTEVTNKQWNTIILDSGLGVNPSQSHTDDNYPLENVNWFEAAYFANRLSVVEGLSQCYTFNDCDNNVPGSGLSCSWVDISANCTGYRLPTEAQWEYAARATTTTAYANQVYFDSSNTEIGNGFNTNLNAMGWYDYNRAMENRSGAPAYENGTKPVATKQANHWGLYDMHGNVLEWCKDWWDSSAYLPDPVTDPLGDSPSGNRVVRGGAWASDARNARSAHRNSFNPGFSYISIGFRLVLPPGQ